MKLYVVGGGGRLIKNFGEFDAGRVVINEDSAPPPKGMTIWPISAPVSPAATLLNLLQNISPQSTSTENASQVDQQEADDTVLDFVDNL